MDHWLPLVFLAAGLILAVVEMATLTFYLAALSFAALVTAAYTWRYESSWWQATVIYAAAAIIALPLAHLLRLRTQGGKDDPVGDMDKGGKVTVASNDNGMLKVKYRDSLWEAVWEGSGQPKIGQRAEIVARDGSKLRVTGIA